MLTAYRILYVKNIQNVQQRSQTGKSLTAFSSCNIFVEAVVTVNGTGLLWQFEKYIVSSHQHAP